MMTFLADQMKQVMALKNAAQKLRLEAREAITSGYMDMIVGAAMWGAAVVSVLAFEGWFLAAAAWCAITGSGFIASGNAAVKDGNAAAIQSDQLNAEADDLVVELADVEKNVTQQFKLEKNIKPVIADMKEPQRKEENKRTGYVSGRGMFAAPALKQNEDEKKDGVVLKSAPRVG